MKKLSILLAMLLLAGGVFAQKAPTTKLISSSEESIVVNFQLNGFSTTEVSTPQGEQFIVNAPKMASILEAGAPDLPLFPIPAIIGDMAEMTVSVIDAQYKDYNMEIAPSKGSFSRQINPDDVPYTYGEVYQQNAFWPATQAYLESPYILRDFRGQNIMVRPFAYNPVTKTLRVYDNLTIAMTKVSDNGENPKTTRKSDQKLAPETKSSYSRRFINFKQTAKYYTFIEDEGEMLVICADQFMASMQPFVDWKNQSGRPTTMVSVTEAGGNNTDAIKSYISSIYNDPSHNLTYVLFVGDYEHITPHPFSYDNATQYSDSWFAQLEGTDYYTEVLIGRFSVQTEAHVTNHVNKVLYYERDMTSDATWGDKGLGIGAIGAGSGHYGEDDYQHIDLIRDTLLHYTYTTVTDLHQGGGASASSISNTINQGVSIINYCNHGSETSWGVANYSTSNVNALTNDNMLPYVWSVACLNGKFNYGGANGECFAEAWMRATDNSTGVPTGAIGGMFSWISQPWQPPMYGQDEMVDILTEWKHNDQFNHTLGGASLNGALYVLDCGSGSTFTATQHSWLLFGDPSLMVRTANPTEMNTTVSPSALMIGMSTLEVSAETTYGIATLSNAEGIIASTKIIDGTAVLEFAPLSNVETLTLTVMGYNKATEVLPLEVLPAEGAYVSVDAFTPGNVPVNEVQLMSMSFKNVGVDPTTDVTNVVLSCENENLTFSDNEGSFDVLAADETITLTDEFAFTVAPGVADGTKIQIDVNMTCGENTWTGKAKITVGAPIVEFESFQAGGGFTPGESQYVIANFRNNGHYMATNAVVTASCTSEYVTFDQDTFEIGTIEAEDSRPAFFNINIDEACPENEVITINFELVADNEVMASGEGVLKNTCNVVFNLTDSYGDGWNGNQLTVSFDNGAPTQNLTISSGSSATYTLEIGLGVHVTLGWITGQYTYECSFTVAYQDGDQITSGSNLNASYHFEFDVNCGGDPLIVTTDPITNLVATLDEENLFVILNWDAPSREDVSYYSVTRNGVEIATVQETEYIDENPTDYAEYCVVANYQLGFSDPVCAEPFENLLGVGETEDNFRIYPNPVNNTLYINGGNAEFSYVLFNGIGQEVAKGTAQGTQKINVANVDKGIYFLRLTTGNQVKTQKIVVK